MSSARPRGGHRRGHHRVHHLGRGPRQPCSGRSASARGAGPRASKRHRRARGGRDRLLRPPLQSRRLAADRRHAGQGGADRLAAITVETLSGERIVVPSANMSSPFPRIQPPPGSRCRSQPTCPCRPAPRRRKQRPSLLEAARDVPQLLDAQRRCLPRQATGRHGDRLWCVLPGGRCQPGGEGARRLPAPALVRRPAPRRLRGRGRERGRALWRRHPRRPVLRRSPAPAPSAR